MNGLRLDALDAVHIKEMVLVVVGEEAFHLCRAHASIGLGDIDHRQIQVREDIHPHTGKGQNRAQGYGGNRDQDGPGMTQGNPNEPHKSVSSRAAAQLVQEGSNVPFCGMQVE